MTTHHRFTLDRPQPPPSFDEGLRLVRSFIARHTGTRGSVGRGPFAPGTVARELTPRLQLMATADLLALAEELRLELPADAAAALDGIRGLVLRQCGRAA